MTDEFTVLGSSLCCSYACEREHNSKVERSSPFCSVEPVMRSSEVLHPGGIYRSSYSFYVLVRQHGSNCFSNDQTLSLYFELFFILQQ